MLPVCAWQFPTSPAKSVTWIHHDPWHYQLPDLWVLRLALFFCLFLIRACQLFLTGLRDVAPTVCGLAPVWPHEVVCVSIWSTHEHVCVDALHKIRVAQGLVIPPQLNQELHRGGGSAAARPSWSFNEDPWQCSQRSIIDLFVSYFHNRHSLTQSTFSLLWEMSETIGSFLRHAH